MILTLQWLASLKIEVNEQQYKWRIETMASCLMVSNRKLNKALMMFLTSLDQYSLLEQPLWGNLRAALFSSFEDQYLAECKQALTEKHNL